MNSQFLQMLVVGVLVGGAAGYVGSLMVTQRMALVGDALGHVALPGIGLALRLQLDASVGALALLLVGIFVIWRLRERTPLPHDTLVGIVFVTSLAVGFLIVPKPELLESLIGDISRISLEGSVVAAAVSVLVFVLIRRLYSGLMLLNISEELASVHGIPAARFNLLFLLSIALIVALGVRVTGTLLVGALVIIPAATARITSENLQEYSSRSAVIGAGSCVVGILAHQLTRFPAGPSIILVNALLFGGALLLRRLRAGATA